MIPMPTQAPRSESFDDASPRRLYCAHYSQCLDHACIHNWKSFSCLLCEVDIRITDTQVRSDMHGLADIFVKIMLPQDDELEDDVVCD